MEWSKIKTILIVVFAIVNIFLFFVYFGDFGSSALSDELIAQTIDVLEIKNVGIDAKLLKNNYESIKVCNVENSYANMQDVLDATLYQEQVLSGDVDVSRNSFTFTPDEGSSFYNLPSSKVEKALKESGLLSDVSYRKEKTEDGVYFYLKFEGKVFFDSYIFVRTKDDYVVSISAYNMLGDTVSEGSLAETVSLPEILINFATENESAKRIDIVGLRTGYYVGTRSETVRVTASPVWQIKTSDNRVFYYDMRNGDLLK